MMRVDELTTEPEVGRYYLVPCVQSLDGVWLPVYGPRHEDAEIIKFTLQHYHYDVRFFSSSDLLRYGGNEDVANTMVRVTTADGPIEYHKRRCRRRMPEFPLVVAYVDGPRTNPIQKPLEDAYRDARVRCGRCPHRGFKLDGLPQDADGNVVCPGHGLAWNLETGALVSRLEAS